MRSTGHSILELQLVYSLQEKRKKEEGRKGREEGREEEGGRGREREGGRERERRSSLPAAAEDAVGGVVVVRAIDVVRVPLPALQHSEV